MSSSVEDSDESEVGVATKEKKDVLEMHAKKSATDLGSSHRLRPHLRLDFATAQLTAAGGERVCVRVSTASKQDWGENKEEEAASSTAGTRPSPSPTRPTWGTTTARLKRSNFGLHNAASRLVLTHATRV